MLTGTSKIRWALIGLFYQSSHNRLALYTQSENSTTSIGLTSTSS